MPVFLLVLLSIILLLLISGGYVFLVGCVRRKEHPWLDEASLKETAYGKYYDHIMEANRFLHANKAQDIYMTSYDGLRLHGLWIPADDAKATVLLAHGYRSTPLVDFGLAYEFYHRIGMNILVPDQRSHGKSQGKFITFGVKESRDFQDWIVYHNKHFGMHPLILSGMSMGASTVLFLADKILPENVRGIIADCGFTSPKEILASVYTHVTRLPAGISLWATEWFARIFAGFSLTEADTRKTLASSRYPVLMFHGGADGFVPCQMSRQGYDACCSAKELVVIDKADHGVSFLVEPDRYGEALIRFLKEHIEKRYR